ncbi:type II toxin-antitoxin system HicB family antitoxin [Nocardia sp. NPDC060256]|uniref:type II toxin-antitoxin system HicB family antitoxin n=1 Tax=unclassified Nocardia TaxID=2637762 RepID=UPI00366747B7
MSSLPELPDHSHYTYRVIWSAEDQEHVGLCTEFPSLSWLEPEPAAALTGIMNLVHEVITELAEKNEPIPQPLSERTYSGKFMVRVPPELHAQLVREAAEQGVSLNLLANQRLAVPSPTRLERPRPAFDTVWPNAALNRVFWSRSGINIINDFDLELQYSVLKQLHARLGESGKAPRSGEPIAANEDTDHQVPSTVDVPVPQK